MPTLIVIFDGISGKVTEKYKVRRGWRVPGPRADGTLTFETDDGIDVRLNWNKVFDTKIEG